MASSALTPFYRTAGVFLLLTALATAISVPTRLMADADATPHTDALARTLNLDAAETARIAMSEKLSAIGSAAAAYGAGGAARLAGGLTLLAAGFFLWRAMGAYHPRSMGAAAILLAASGIASAVSGGCAISLAVIAEEPRAADMLVSAESSVSSAESALFTLRWAAGSLGFSLAGLGLAAMAPAQWRMGGILRVTAVLDAVLGVAMLFIWVDAATAVHRVTGVAFLVWLILVGLWLAVPRIRALGAASAANSMQTP